jgi:Methyltransferase domain
MTSELRGYDPGQWGHSLANAAEFLIPILDAVKPRFVVEVGAYAGDLTRELLAWADRNGAKVAAIDPSPEPELERLVRQRPDLELVRALSHEALKELRPPDAAIIDGDHNYYTVSEELRLIAERAEPGPLPLLVLHDVCWPHGRRDTYWSPDATPPEHRHEMVEGGRLAPWDTGLVREGIPFKWTATREGGPRNGVLTALEDFAAARPGTRLAIIPAFFGVGVAWSEGAAWAEAVESLVGPWDRHPVLARLEANRVRHLVSEHARHVQLHDIHVELERLRTRIGTLEKHAAIYEQLLRSMEHSRTLRLAGLLSRLRHPRRPARWRQAIGQALAASREEPAADR